MSGRQPRQVQRKLGEADGDNWQLGSPAPASTTDDKTQAVAGYKRRAPTATAGPKPDPTVPAICRQRFTTTPPIASGAGAGGGRPRKMKFRSSARPDLRITPAWRLRPRPALPGQPSAIGRKMHEKTPTKKSLAAAIAHRGLVIHIAM